MTPRQGLWMALVGLVIGVVSVVPAYVIPLTPDGTPGGASDLTASLVILLFPSCCKLRPPRAAKA